MIKMHDRDIAVGYLRGIGAVVLGAILVSCLSAPPIFNGLTRLADFFPQSRHLTDLEFGRVVTRAFLVCLVLFSWMAVRRMHSWNWSALGVPRHPQWRQALGRGLCWGLVTVALVMAVALIGGGVVWNPPAWTRWAPRIITYGIGAVLIGFIEEIFFRGALFGMGRRLWPWFVVAVVTSAFFSWVHFISPRFPEAVETARWFDGFRILPHLLDTSRATDYYWPFAFNLFLIGMVLCTWYQREGHLWTVIGVHAGWVWMLRTARLFLDRDPETMTWWWGTTSHIGRSGLTTIMLLLMWAWIFWQRPSEPISSQDDAV